MVRLCYPQMLRVRRQLAKDQKCPPNSKTPSVLNMFSLSLVIILHADSQAVIYTAVTA